MARNFEINAQLKISRITNAKSVVSQLKKELQGVKVDVGINLSKTAANNVRNLTGQLQSLNSELKTTAALSKEAAKNLSSITGATGKVRSASDSMARSAKKVANSMREISKEAKKSATEMEEFGRQGGLAVRRFGSFALATGAILGFIGAVRNGISEAIRFEKQLIKIAQVSGGTFRNVQSIERTITQLSTSLGVASSELSEIALIFAQTGRSGLQLRQALEAVAKTDLSPTFTNLGATAEGAVAALEQFTLSTRDLEKALGSINAVAGKFAVEADDIIAAIRRTGGVFAAASGNVSQGTDALNEFIAVFTAVRSTSRESAESIATGLRTIFTRLQRRSTIDALNQLGVSLTDVEGKFIGPLRAVQVLGRALADLARSGDPRFFQIQEQLGGFRQIGKTIPLLTQQVKITKALEVAQRGQQSLAQDVADAQLGLANRIVKTREEFQALIREFTQTNSFKALANTLLTVADSFISFGRAAKPILPILTTFLAIKGTQQGFQFFKGFSKGIRSLEEAGGFAENLGSLGGSSRQEAKKNVTKNTSAMETNTKALDRLTKEVTSLNQRIGLVGPGRVTRNQGGPIGLNTGGFVPGTGNRDTVPANLTPGEFVIRKKSAEMLGSNFLQKLNDGGVVQRLTGSGRFQLGKGQLKNVKAEDLIAVAGIPKEERTLGLYADLLKTDISNLSTGKGKKLIRDIENAITGSTPEQNRNERRAANRGQVNLPIPFGGIFNNAGDFNAPFSIPAGSLRTSDQKKLTKVFGKGTIKKGTPVTAPNSQKFTINKSSVQDFVNGFVDNVFVPGFTGEGGIIPSSRAGEFRQILSGSAGNAIKGTAFDAAFRGITGAATGSDRSIFDIFPSREGDRVNFGALLGEGEAQRLQSLPSS